LNAPDQTVIAGSDEAVDAAVSRLAAAGLSARRILVACAFHSPIVAAAGEAFRRRLDGVSVVAPRVPVYSNTTAERYPDDADAIRARLGEQIGRTVRFADEIEAMYAAGARIFVEAGPGTVLTDLVDRVLGDRPHLAVAIDRSGEPGLPTFLGALARLCTAGVDVDLRPLYVGRGARTLDLAAPPRVGPSPTAWMVNGQMARPLVGELPDFAMRPIMNPIVVEKRPAEPPRDAVLLEYLRAMRELAEAQRQVLLRYLGDGVVDAMVLPAAPAPPALPPPPANGHAKIVAPPVAKSPLEGLVAGVGEGTGDPAEMLDPDLDMEADLGIDSIKRIEILGTLGERIGMAAAAEGERSAMIEELAGVKTLRGIAGWVEKRTSTATSPSPSPSTSTTTSTSTSTSTTTTTPEEESIGRYVLALEPLAAAAGTLKVDGKTFAITDDGRGIARALAALLVCNGADARVVAIGDAVGKVDGLV